MIVVDTDVIAALFLPSENKGKVENLYLRHEEWSAPLLWKSEFRNVLAGFLRKKVLTLEQAGSLIALAEGLFKGREFQVHSTDVLDLVAKSGCSAYDCEYVALAKELSIPLVTYDGQILKNFPGYAVTPVAYLSRK